MLSLNGAIFIALVFFILTTIFIFTYKRAYAFRFMYPGLLTFFVFVVIPIFFSIYIGFTNLSTGHILTPQSVKNIFLSETQMTENSKKLGFKLYKDDDYLIVTTDGQNAKFDLGDKEIKLSSKFIDLEKKIPLSLGEVFELQNDLKESQFITKTGTKLSYYRANNLAELSHRFTETEDGKLKEVNSDKIYYRDNVKGFYTDGTDKLAPGYFVTVGLGNFKKIINDDNMRSTFSSVFLWTMTWGVMSVALSFIMGMFLAIVVNDKGLKCKPLYRILLIIPYSIPFFISVLIFKGMLNQDFGIINEVLSNIGFDKLPWLETSFWAKVSCLMVNLWLGFPYMFLVTTGILQSIPESVYEAATLDGAKRWQMFKKITLPLITSAVAPLLVGSFAFNMNNFVGIYLLTGGGPPIAGAVTPVGNTDILISYTYRLAFEGGRGQDFGLAASISLFIFLIIAVLTVINFKISGISKENQER